ncbi:MAG: signal peptidase I [Candidatus Aquicultorales bacterium]
MLHSRGGNIIIDRPKTKRRVRSSLFARIIIAVIAIDLALIFMAQFVTGLFYVDSGSMEPTLSPQNRVFVLKTAYLFAEPVRGEIIVFNSEIGPKIMIKRMVAVSGDRLQIRDGVVHVNGRRVDEPYAKIEKTYNFGPVTIPDDAVFVMGDNRPSSRDSRFFGPVRKDAIIGKAFVVVWPVDDLRLLNF